RSFGNLRIPLQRLDAMARAGIEMGDQMPRADHLENAERRPLLPEAFRSQTDTDFGEADLRRRQPQGDGLRAIRSRRGTLLRLDPDGNALAEPFAFRQDVGPWQGERPHIG